MRLHCSIPLIAAATVSLVACTEDLQSPTNTDAGADVHHNDVAIAPDVADDVHTSEDGSFRDENAKPDVQDNDAVGDGSMADRQSDVITADVPKDNDGSADAPLDRGVPTRPDGGQFSCDYTWEMRGFVFSATLPTGDSDRCGSIPTDGGSLDRTAHRKFSGVVKSVNSTTANHYEITIDTCTGDACATQDVVLEIISTTTPVTLPVGAFVETEYWINQSFACSYFVRFSNLPQFDGRTNPISDKNKIYFIGSDGFFDSNPQMAPVGVAVSLLPLGCPQEGGFGGTPNAPVDTYVYRFSHNGSDLILANAESTTWTVGGQSVLVKNLRSYQTNATDDYWNWAYTFVGQ